MNESDQTCSCGRCGAVCRVTSQRNVDAKLLRRSVAPAGVCVNCAVSEWLANTYPVNMLLEQSGPQSLLYPHIQEQFAVIMRGGYADASPEEINWALVVANWDLPIKTKITRTNPHRFRDKPRSR